MASNRLCVVCQERPSEDGYCGACHDSYLDSQLEPMDWAARRARSYERRRWRRMCAQCIPAAKDAARRARQ